MDKLALMFVVFLTLGNVAVPSFVHSADGVRRIQTVGYRYEDPNGPGFGPGGAFGAGEGELGEVGTQSPPVETHWTEREYVYGPVYVDEFVAEFDQDGAPLFFLQDANYNVVSLTDANGAIVEQRVYEPYGELAAGETFGEHGVSRVGHQGLFFERTSGDVDDPPIAPGALGFYYNRNRMYSPTLGRFMQRDPNETALPIMTAMSMNARAMDLLLSGFNPTSLYGDGMNLYQYLGSNPISGLDPSGLDDFDNAINGLTGQNLAAIGLLNEGARIASIGLGFAMDIASSLLGVDVLQSVYLLANGQGGFWEALDIFMTVNPIGRIAKIGAVMGMASDIARRGRGAAKVVGTIFEHLGKRGTYRQLKKLTKGKKGAIQAHHIMERRFLKMLGKSIEDGPSVILTDIQHNKVTSELFRRLYTVRTYTKKDLPEIWQVYHDVYTDFGHAEWLTDIEKYFR